MPSAPLACFAVLISLLAGTCVETTDRPWDGSLACGGACLAPRPFCLESEAVCVACRTGGDCTLDAPICDPAAHVCGACTTSAECPLTAPVCDLGTGRCHGCVGDGDCTAHSDARACNESSGFCVACTADTEVANCGAFSCDPTTLACTETVRGSVGFCGTCRTDSECGAGSLCVTRTYLDAPVGNYCLPQKPTQGCGSTQTNPGLLPLWVEDAVVSVRGVAGTVCRPSDGVSCIALQRAGNECTTEGVGPTDLCGDPTMHDGQCALFGSSSFQCRYTCIVGADCRNGQTCTQLSGDATAVCR